MTNLFDDAIFKSGISFSVGIILSAIVSLGIKPYFDLRQRQNEERRAFRALTHDVIRHVILTLAEFYKIRKQMDMLIKDHCQDKIFRFSHLQKAFLSKGSDIFLEELYKYGPPDLTGEMHHLRLRVRNFEIDIEEAIDSYKKQNWQSIYTALDRLVAQTEALRDKCYSTLKEVEPYTNSYQAKYDKMLDDKMKINPPVFVDFRDRLVKFL